jgi:chromosome segregation ATPase
MFKAMFRWVKAVGYLMTGQIDSARRTLDMNPHVVRAKFDEISREKIDRIQQYKQAVAGLISQQEIKVQKVKTLTDDVQRLGNLKAGALAKAKRRVEELQAQGLEKDAIHADEEYMKCLGAYNDFSSTLSEKQARIDELEGDVGNYGKRIGEHKVQLQSLLREVEELKAEAADTVADVITAKQEKEIADTLSGIAQDGTAEELQRMRQLRQEVKAEARISKELAGTDTRSQEAEFLEYARESQHANDFDALIGLAGEADSPLANAEPESSSELPE